jgi:excinuclease ABC subunit B
MDYPEIAGAEALSGEEDEALAWTPKELRGELARLRADMMRAAEELAFEEAASLRDRIKVLERMELRK